MLNDLFAVKSVSSRRTNHDFAQAHPSPSGSPTNESESHLSFGGRLEVASLAVDLNCLPSRKGDFGCPQSYNPTSLLNDDQFEFPDSKCSPIDNIRVRSNSNVASYDDRAITVDPRRLNIEATMSGIDSLVNEEPTDSPESDASWFSESSSVDGKETDSNDQDSPSYRERFLQLNTATYEGAGLPLDDDRVAEIDSMTRTSSSRVIQRSWRQWKMKQQSVAVTKDESPADLDVDGQHDQKKLRVGVLVQKVSGGGGSSTHKWSI